MATIKKGFITDQLGQNLLPITRAELVLDSAGIIALNSEQFLAKNGLPGLVTATERALINQLSGGGEGQNLADIYNKINYINNGFKINGTPVRFYNDASNTGTPINITTVLDDANNPTLSLGVDTNNTISIGLNTLTQSDTSISSILRNISVDKYGRVTSVTGSDLTSADIPQVLTDKILSGATTSIKEIADDEKAIVNKAYVDAKFDSISTIATGALTFGGTLSTWESAKGALSNNNYYYKVVVRDIEIPANNIYTPTGVTPILNIAKPGDTLIVKDGKFVYIPSGDEIQTSITIENKNKRPLENTMGDIVFNFSDIFDVAGQGNTAIISIPQAGIDENNNPQGGYLSASDYVKFNSYASAGSTTYVPTVKGNDAGAYKIGTIVIAGINNDVYGLNNETSLSLITDTSGNPALQFSEAGTLTNFVIQGQNGVNVEKDANTIKLSSTNTVNSASTNYLEIADNHNFKIKIGNYDSETGQLTNGLVSYEQFYEYKEQVFYGTTTFKEIADSLTDTQKTYYYGSDALIGAINVTI